MVSVLRVGPSTHPRQHPAPVAMRPPRSTVPPVSLPAAKTSSDSGVSIWVLFGVLVLVLAFKLEMGSAPKRGKW